MHVNLLDYTSGKESVMAIIRIEDGQMVVEGAVPPRLRKTLEFEYEHAQQHGQEGETFLLKLPRIFSGTYTRAQFIKD